MSDTIKVRPRYDWLRRAQANQPFSAADGQTYQCDHEGTATVAADSGQELHPDWELVEGTPIPRAIDPETGDAVLIPGEFRWVFAKLNHLRGGQASGPGPIQFTAHFDASGRAAVPDNSGFGDHPDYEWGEYLTEEEVAQFARTAAPQPKNAAVPAFVQDQIEAARIKALAAQMQAGAPVPELVNPTLGMLQGVVDPNSTGFQGVTMPLPSTEGLVTVPDPGPAPQAPPPSPVLEALKAQPAQVVQDPVSGEFRPVETASAPAQPSEAVVSQEAPAPAVSEAPAAEVKKPLSGAQRRKAAADAAKKAAQSG